MSYRNPAYLAKVAATCRRDLGRTRRDGHRRRLVRARVARLRLRFPAGGGAAARMLGEGVEIMHQAWTTGTATLDGEHYQRRRRDRAAAAAAGGRHPDVGRRRRREGDAEDRGEVRAVHELHGQPRGVRAASATSCAGTARGTRHRLRRDHAFVELQHRDRHGCRGRRLLAGSTRSRRASRCHLGPEKTAHFIADFQQPECRGGHARRRSWRGSPSGASSASTTPSRTSPRRRSRPARGSSCGRRRSFPRCSGVRRRRFAGAPTPAPRGDGLVEPCRPALRRSAQ